MQPIYTFAFSPLQHQPKHPQQNERYVYKIGHQYPQHGHQNNRALPRDCHTPCTPRSAMRPGTISITITDYIYYIGSQITSLYAKSPKASQIVTRPANTARAYLHTKFASFSNLKLMLLYTYLCYLNETFRTYSKMHKELY